MIPHISLLELLRGGKASTGAELNGGTDPQVTTWAWFWPLGPGEAFGFAAIV